MKEYVENANLEMKFTMLILMVLIITSQDKFHITFM